MKKVLCPGEALIDFISTSAGKSLKETEGFIKKLVGLLQMLQQQYQN